jgi:prolyl oligopeptidase
MDWNVKPARTPKLFFLYLFIANYIFVSSPSKKKSNNNMRSIFIYFSLSMISTNLFSQTIKYPITDKGTVTDNYFGTNIADPYRWLEDDTSAATGQWVKAQNNITQSYISKIPFREKINKDLTKMWDFAKYANAFRKGDYFYFYKNDGLQNQAVIYRQKGMDGKPEEFLNPNALSKDGTVSLGDLSFSSNNKYVAYTVSASGSDWQDVYIMDVATKQLIKDKITYTKFSGIAWKGDQTFYYSGYDRPKSEETKYSAKSEYQKIFMHAIGTSQDADALIFEDKEKPLLYKGVSLTEDERFLILYLSEGTDGTEIRYIDLKNKAMKSFVTILPGYEFNYSIIDNIGEQFILYTNHNAPNYQAVLLDPKHPEPANWKPFIKETTEKLDGVSIAGNQIFAHYLKDASTAIVRYDMKGKELGVVPSPGIGTLSGFGGSRKDKETFYGFTSFNSPNTIYKYDLATNKSTIFKQPSLLFNPDDYVVKQVKFKSKDGTMVPMFLVHAKGVVLKTGTTPVFMYGYGGFNISLTPSFSVPYLYFMQQGGVYAMVNLRGGSEYGEEWHSAGMLAKKQNVFDDFIGAAEYLIAEGITCKEKLAIHGRSNGGLLVGACMTQRPDLFQVALPGVGVLDMLRYHKFTVGWGWAVEYGSSEKKDEFDYLIKYSPLHCLKSGTNYPATMITTADHDDRVVPAHSFKFAAALQANHEGKNAVLIRIDAKAGHGAGKPTSKQIDEWTDVLTFTMFNLKMRLR